MGQDKSVADLDLVEAKFLTSDLTVGKAIDMMLADSESQFAIKNAEGKVIGVLTSDHLMTRVVKRKVTLEDTLDKIVQTKDLRRISSSVKLNELARILARNKYVLVDDKSICTITDMLRFLRGAPVAEVKQQKETHEPEASGPSNVGFKIVAATLGGA